MTDRNPDIEIYIKRAEVKDVLDWLKERFSMGTISTSGDATKVALTFKDQPLVCTIIPGAVKGGYTSVCFEPNATPWDLDEACAVEAFAHFSAEVRCSTGGWTDDATDEGGWYRFTDNGRSVVNWLA